MNLRAALSNSVRSYFSADKNRTVYGNINIDLTYITDRILAMSFPADGVESTYRNDINDVVTFLEGMHRDHYMVYNLTERSYDYSKFSNVNSSFGWPDHHAPPSITLALLMKNIHVYLSAHPLNVVVIHCLAGKGRTGTAIACYLIYSGLYTEGLPARKFFAYKRSNTNWGVVGPSQVRTVDNFASFCRDGMPEWKPLLLKSLTFSKMPSLYLGPGKSSGCTPIINLFEYNYVNLPDAQPLIWTNESYQKTYPESQENVVFPIGVIVQGDLEFEISHVNWGRRDSIAILTFNSAVVTKGGMVVRFNKVDIDTANNDSRFPYDFYIELTFGTVPQGTPLTVAMKDFTMVDAPFWDMIRNTPVFYPAELQSRSQLDGTICFFCDDKLPQKLAEAKSFGEEPTDMTCANNAKMNKGGWLTKLGSSHTLKREWKRRWFVLHPDRIEYFKKPNATQMGPIGTLNISEIEAVIPLTGPDDVYDANDHASPFPNSFTILTNNANVGHYVVYADNDVICQEWLEAITLTVQCWSAKQIKRRNSAYGHMTVAVDSARGLTRQAITKTTVDSYAVVKFGDLSWRTKTVYNSLNPVWIDQNFEFWLYSDLEELPKLQIEIFDEHILGDDMVGACVFDLTSFINRTAPTRVQKWCPLSSVFKEEIQVTFKYVPNQPATNNLPDVIPNPSELTTIASSTNTPVKALPNPSNNTNSNANAQASSPNVPSVALDGVRSPFKALPSPRETRSSTFDSASLAQSRGPRDDVHSPRTNSASRPKESKEPKEAKEKEALTLDEPEDEPVEAHPMSATFPSMDLRQKNRSRTQAKTNIHAVDSSPRSPSHPTPQPITAPIVTNAPESPKLKSSSSSIPVNNPAPNPDEGRNKLAYNYTQSYKQLPPTPLNLSQKKNLLTNLDANYTNLPAPDKHGDDAFNSSEWTLM